MWDHSSEFNNLKLFVLLLSLVLSHCSLIDDHTVFASVRQDDVPCTFIYQESYWDLTPLRNSPNGWEGSDVDYTYYLNFCAEVESKAECATSDKQGGLCQYRKTGEFMHSISSWSYPPENLPVWQPLDGSPSNGLLIIFSNGDVCAYNGHAYPRDLNLRLICDPNAGTGGAYTITVSANPPCTYTLQFRTAVACPGPIPKSVTGLSGGWIFIIILIVVIPVYCVLGCIYNRKRKGTTGMVESIPNVEFWKDLPSLVKEGCQFVYQRVRNKIRGGGEYETIK